MSATQNENDVKALSGQEGQIGSKVAPSEPLMTTGHQVGKIVSPEDAAPEFHAKAYPPGTAPPENTFKPNPTDEAPPLTNYAPSKNADSGSTTTSAQDTIGGATSADVHTGMGKPIQGQSSAELHHDGSSGKSKDPSGLEGVGAGSSETRLPGDRVPGMAKGTGSGVDAHEPSQSNQRGLNKERTDNDHKGTTDASEREPESATTVAREAAS